MASKIQVRRGLAAQAALVTFDAAEPFFCTDTKEWGMGDGVTVGGIKALVRLIVTATLASAIDFKTVDLTALGLPNPPTLIIPFIYKLDGTKANFTAHPRLGWTATSFTCDFNAALDDATYVLKLLIIP